MKGRVELVRIFNAASPFNKIWNTKGLIQEINLPRLNDGAYVINFDEFKSIGAH